MTRAFESATAIVGPMWEGGTSIEFAALRLGGFRPPPSPL